MKRKTLLNELDRAIADRNLLKHPFYQDWQAGSLSLESLQLYAAQYYLHVEAFPLHLEALADRASGALRLLILENLADEQDPVAPHASLWRDFAAATGVPEEILSAVSPLPGVQRLVETYRNICAERALPQAVAALYAYEAQVPEISTSKMDGLRRHYGVKTAAGLAYFKVHEKGDRVHRAAWRRWLERCDRYDVSVDVKQIVSTAQEALNALWGALDSVQEART